MGIAGQSGAGPHVAVGPAEELAFCSGDTEKHGSLRVLAACPLGLVLSQTVLGATGVACMAGGS